MDESLSQLAESLKDMIIFEASGGTMNDAEYRSRRKRLMAALEIRHLIPEFVQERSDRNQVWDFLSTKYDNQTAMKRYVWDQFRPLLGHLEKSELSAGGMIAVQAEHSLDVANRFGEDVRAEATAMAAHYVTFYCLEKSIRQLLRQSLQATSGGNWWHTSVPPTIQNEIEKRMQRELDAAVTLRSTDPLDFTTFGELSDIINANWKTLAVKFKSQKAVGKVLATLNTVRGPIAHCSPLAEDEVLRLQVAVNDWFRTINA